MFFSAALFLSAAALRFSLFLHMWRQAPPSPPLISEFRKAADRSRVAADFLYIKFSIQRQSPVLPPFTAATIFAIRQL
jgi:hypothetical protein